MPHSLMPSMSFHKPLRNLISYLVTTSTSNHNNESKEEEVIYFREKSEFISVLYFTTAHIFRDPLLIHFFISTTNNTTTIPLFQGLKNHILDEGNPGDLARLAILLLLQIQVQIPVQLPNKEPVSIFMYEYILQHSSLPDLLVF